MVIYKTKTTAYQCTQIIIWNNNRYNTQVRQVTLLPSMWDINPATAMAARSILRGLQLHAIYLLASFLLQRVNQSEIWRHIARLSTTLHRRDRHIRNNWGRHAPSSSGHRQHCNREPQIVALHQACVVFVYSANLSCNINTALDMYEWAPCDEDASWHIAETTRLVH